MSITKTAAGTFRLEIAYPKKIQILLKGKRKFRQTFPTKRMAQLKEVEIKQKIIKAEQENSPLAFEVKSNISFANFYKDVFMPMYFSDATGRTNIVPTEATVDFQKRVFRLHLLPLFGQYSLKYLNSHKNLILTELTLLSEHYAATRKITCYIQQLFDTAEALDYIEYNHVTSILRFVSEPKAMTLKAAREKAGLSLTAKELIDWLDAVDADYKNGLISLMDHLLFMLTLHIGDRKSESYSLQCKHISFNTCTLYLAQSLNKFSKIKSTKSHKLSQLLIPKELISELIEWKELQDQELKQVGIEQTLDQFLFTTLIIKAIRICPYIRIILTIASSRLRKDTLS